MELTLTETEVRVLTEILEADRKDLLMQIARTDNRAMKAGLKVREDLLRGILERLGGELREAS